jgi:hypothetical protein
MDSSDTQLLYSGGWQGTRVHFVKQYIGQHKVDYSGEMTESSIDGVWTIRDLSGNFGDFHLELERCDSVSGERDGGDFQVGKMQHWTGLDKLGSKTSGDILFTDSQNVYGSGVDAFGLFTWLGEISITPLASLRSWTAKPSTVYPYSCPK